MHVCLITLEIDLVEIDLCRRTWRRFQDRGRCWQEEQWRWRSSLNAHAFQWEWRMQTSRVLQSFQNRSDEKSSWWTTTRSRDQWSWRQGVPWGRPRPPSQQGPSQAWPIVGWMNTHQKMSFKNNRIINSYHTLWNTRVHAHDRYMTLTSSCMTWCSFILMTRQIQR